MERAIDIMAENGGIVSAAMRKAGFSAEYSRQPQKFVKTKKFQQLADIMMPDIDLLAGHRSLLKANVFSQFSIPMEKVDDEIIDTPTDKEIEKMFSGRGCTIMQIRLIGEHKHVLFTAPDQKARKAGIELGYKIKGHLKDPEKSPPILLDFSGLRDKFK